MKAHGFPGRKHVHGRIHELESDDDSTGEGPAGSHALSGSWRPVKTESVSDAGLLISYKLEGDTLIMSRPTGMGYKAKLDGTVAPYEGDPEKHGVSVRRVDANTFEETDKLNGKPISIRV